DVLLSGAGEDDVAAVRRALEQGVPADASESGITALKLTSTADIARLLLAHGAKLSASPPAVKGTALADTLMTRRLAVAEVLLQAGADPNERASSPDGMTPLETARLMRDDDAVELLLRYGAIDEP